MSSQKLLKENQLTTEEAVDKKNEEIQDKNRLSWIAGRVMELARTSRAGARESKALLLEARPLCKKWEDDYSDFYSWHQSISKRILAEMEAENDLSENQSKSFNPYNDTYQPVLGR